MAYSGQTFRIPCSRGGANYSPNFDLVPAESMVDPTKNINLHTGGRTKRGGTAHVNASAVTGTPAILNGHDFRLESGTRFVVFRGNDGKLYKNFTDTIKTGLSTTNRGTFQAFGDELYHTDGETTPQTWDGAAASTSDISTPAVDWSGTHQPKYVLKHGRGASQRLWFWGVDNAVDRLYYTDNNDGKDVAGGGVLVIETGDGFGLIGGVEFGERLVMFGKKNAYIVNDEDASSANWGYQKAQWEGGAGNHHLIVKTPNDVVVMAEDGDIYSVSAVQSFGDYKQASIARPAFMHQWIMDNVNLSQIDAFHAIYDRALRAIKFFVVRNSQSAIDTALVYFIDRSPEEAWTIHDNLEADSGYKASCSFEVRKATGDYKVYTGDFGGFAWELESSAKNDNSSGYESKFRTPPLSFENPLMLKRYRRGRLVFHTKGDYNVTLNWWVDNVQQTAKTISTAGGGYTYGSGTYGTAVYAGQEITDEAFDLGSVGKRIQLECLNDAPDEDFFISQIFIDHEALGARPE